MHGTVTTQKSHTQTMGTSNTKGASLGGSEHVQLPSLLLFWIPRPCHSGVRQLAYKVHFDVLLPPSLYRLRHPEVLKSMMPGGKLLSNPVTFALTSKPVSGDEASSPVYDWAVWIFWLDFINNVTTC
jgi:hypothetical protein